MAHPAFSTWDVNANASLEKVEERIHGRMSDLRRRAANHVNALVQRFPWSAPPQGAQVMEIGSGVGYIMEAAVERLQPARIVGLDVAANMLELARERLRRDGKLEDRHEFVHYDGVTVPFPDDSLDYIYSVACIQHIPKPYAYNLFFEIQRLLKPGGFAALHMLAFSSIPALVKSSGQPFRAEVEKQLHNRAGHWHHFYSFDELFHLLSDGVGVDLLDIQEGPETIWACFSKGGSPRKFYRDDLPNRLSAKR